MLDALPADLIYHVWQFIGDMQHLLRLCGVSSHIQYALRKPYRKLVRYRLLLTDPRCLDPHWCMEQLRACDFETLHDVSASFEKKRHVPHESYIMLLALVKCGVTHVFTVDMGTAGTLLFSTQHAMIPHEHFRDHIKCVCWPQSIGDSAWLEVIRSNPAPLIAVVDFYGGFYPTTQMTRLPNLIFGLMYDPLTALMARYRVRKRCNVCDTVVHMVPHHKRNPGLCGRCFNKYRYIMRVQAARPF